MGARRKIFLAPEEMNDVLPQEQIYWERIRRVIEDLPADFGFNRIETPLLEKRDLFIKGMGDNKEFVENDFFNLTTKKRDKLALRPDLTLPILRACIENNLFETLLSPIKLFSVGPVYSYENLPPIGKKQAYQANFQIIGGESAVLEAQLMQFFRALVNRLGIRKIIAQINYIGCNKCRANYRKSLIGYYRYKKNKLCSNCKNVLSENPLKLLLCSQEDCLELSQEAPQAIDFLCEKCRAHLRELLEYLDELNIPYILNSKVVGNFNYYNRTVFSLQPEDDEFLGLSLAEGGRYDNLFRSLGGEETTALGLSINLDNLVDLMKEKKIKFPEKRKNSVFLVQLGAQAKKKSLNLFDNLRKLNIPVNACFSEDSMKPQLTHAEKLNARFALILGQKEVMDESIIIRDMDSGSQELIPLAKIIKQVKKKLKS